MTRRRATRHALAFLIPLLLAPALVRAADHSRGAPVHPIDPDVPPGHILIDDIIVPEDFFTNRATFGAGSFPWDRHVVYYLFANDVAVINRTRTLAAMAEIEAVSSVKFLELADSNGYILIRNSTGNSSFVGKTGATPQILNMVSWSFRYIIVHELLHALGLWHEQQRPDRDQFVQINLANIQAGREHNFDVIPGADTVGPYDFDSVMHYDPCAFSTCCPAGSTCACPSGCQTITAIPPYEAFQSLMGQRDHLSQGDIDWLVHVYGEPDCNGNGQPDFDDIQSGFSIDCNANGVPDECDLADGPNPTHSDAAYGFGPYADCNTNGLLDSCDLAAGTALDCNANLIPDACDIASGTSADVNLDGEPDECTPIPGPFTLASPPNGAADLPTGPSFDWSDATGADDYLLEISPTPAFSVLSVSQAVAASAAALPDATLAAETTYYWRVKARNVGGEVLSSPGVSAFTTAPPPLCAADLNNDGQTNVIDFSIFSANFGRTDLTPGTGGDYDDDGDSDIFDFSIFASDFGCPS